MVSEGREFEYRTHPRDTNTDSICMSDCELKKLLVQRLCLVAKNLDVTDNLVGMLSGDGLLDSETEFVDCVTELSGCAWNCEPAIDVLSTDLTVLHLTAALGMAQLITALIKWRLHSLADAFIYISNFNEQPQLTERLQSYR